MYWHLKFLILALTFENFFLSQEFAQWKSKEQIFPFLLSPSKQLQSARVILKYITELYSNNQNYFRKDSTIGDVFQQCFSLSNLYILQQAIVCGICLHTRKTNIP